MTMKSKNKSKDIIILIVGSLLFLALWYLNGLLARGDNVALLSNLGGMQGVLGQIQVVICISMLLLTKKKGLITATVLNAFNLCFVLFIQVIKGGSRGAIPGVVVSAISILTCFIIYFYVSRTDKMNTELNESYQKAIEQAQQLKDKDESLRFLAYYDRLTSMPNRVMFMENINERINAQRTSSVVYIDLDDFRHINDTFGHNLGDELLIRYSERINNLCSDNIFAAKIGGDEFGLILPEQYTAEDVMSFVGEVARVFSEPVNIRGDVFSMTASFGVSIFPTDTRSAEDLFRSAETAMFSAKANGKNQLCFYRR